MKRLFLRLIQFLKQRTYRLFHFKCDQASIEIIFQNRLVLWLTGILFLWYLISPTQTVVMFLLAVVGILLFSYFWARQMALRVLVIRRLHYAAFQVGDELEEWISIQNKSFLPLLWGELFDESDMPGYNLTGVRSVSGGTTNDLRMRTLCKVRGVFRLGPWRFISGDPLGLFRVEHRYLNSQEILVYPPLAPLPPQVLSHHFTMGDLRSLRQPVAAETINAFSTRSYQPGDPLRRIHWPTTARRDAPFVRVFDPEASSSTWLVPDFNALTHIGEGDEGTEEKMVILTASLADELLRRKLAVGLAAFNDGLHVFAPRQGRANFWPLLKVLVPIRKSNTSSIHVTLARMRSLVSSRDLIVVITPSLDIAWVNSLKQMAGARLISRLQVIILDPISFGADLPESAFAAWTAQTGLSMLRVRKEEITPEGGIFGLSSHWEFSVSGTGRAVVSQAPRLSESFQENA